MLTERREAGREKEEEEEVKKKPPVRRRGRVSEGTCRPEDVGVQVQIGSGKKGPDGSTVEGTPDTRGPRMYQS